jgi:chloramphenicol 3-O-phosphotransferase
MLEVVNRSSVHVLLYGAPASGKLTVAQALAARTGYRVVHNHLTTDLVSQVLDRGAPGFWDLVKEFRLRLFATAAAGGIDVVSTMAYVPKDRPFITEIEAAVRGHGGQVVFVGLRPSVETLEQRVLNQSRLGSRKLHTVQSLRAALREADYFSAINADDLVIDNSSLSADETADRIVGHVSLEE